MIYIVKQALPFPASDLPVNVFTKFAREGKPGFHIALRRSRSAMIEAVDRLDAQMCIVDELDMEGINMRDTESVLAFCKRQKFVPCFPQSVGE